MLPPKLIMAPVDFSDYSREAVEAATTLASKFGSELCLVHVVPAIPKLPSASALFNEGKYEQALHEDAEKRLNEIASKAKQGGITARTIIGTANDVSMELLRIAEHENVDLIVIASHGVTGWHKLAFGSVAEKVVSLATCPVLVLRKEAVASPAKAAGAGTL